MISSETDPLQTPADSDISTTKRKDTNTTSSSSRLTRITTSSVGIILVLITMSIFVKSVSNSHNNKNHNNNNNNKVSDDPAFPLLGSSSSKQQSQHHRTPKAIDQIRAFLYAWRDGRCEDLASLVVISTKKKYHRNYKHHHDSSFEFRVTAFGGGDNDSEEGDDDEEFVFDLEEFIELLCLPYKGQFEINFEDDNQHQNLGRTFGSIRAVGSDYYVNEDNVPCLAPYYASFVVELDMEDGRIKSLRELVHNVEMYDMYTSECMRRGFTLDYYNKSEDGNNIGTPKHRLLSSQQQAKERNLKESSSALSSPSPSNIDNVKKFMDLYCTGYCDEAMDYLDESFTFQESYMSPTPILDRDAYGEMCRNDFLTEPEIFISLIEVIDGTTVTMTGQGFQMIAAHQKSSSSEGGNRPCPIFAKESFFIHFTSDGKISSMYVALEDTYFNDYMTCQE